ncbi:MAG: DUF4446 family protein, partial [Solirubrobacterales bacterium]
GYPSSVPDDLTSAAGIAALAAGGVAMVALLLALLLFAKLRKLRRAQTVVLGTSGERDLITHAEGIEIAFVELRELVESTFAQVQRRLETDEARIARGISRTAVIRYDAYNEMSGRQSSSMAFLDEQGTGVVLSSILHRDQARLYVKGVRDGTAELELSPEEDQAVKTALGRQSVDAAREASPPAASAKAASG